MSGVALSDAFEHWFTIQFFVHSVIMMESEPCAEKNTVKKFTIIKAW